MKDLVEDELEFLKGQDEWKNARSKNTLFISSLLHNIENEIIYRSDDALEERLPRTGGEYSKDYTNSEKTLRYEYRRNNK